MGKEIWKDIDDYEGFYQVSNLGRVRSLDNWTMKYLIWNGVLVLTIIVMVVE